MHKKGFAPILILLTIIALGIIGFVSYNFGIKNISDRQFIIPTPTTFLEETKDWKVYNNELFQIKYPNNFEITLDEIGGPRFYLQTIEPDECGSGGCDLGYRPVSLLITTEKADETIENLMSVQIRDIERLNPNTKFVTKEVSINDFTGISYEYECLGYCRTVLFKTVDPQTFKIEEVYGNKEEYEEYSTIADQILSTFEYLK